jgi:hypothetical protein
LAALSHVVDASELAAEADAGDALHLVTSPSVLHETLRYATGCAEARWYAASQAQVAAPHSFGMLSSVLELSDIVEREQPQLRVQQHAQPILLGSFTAVPEPALLPLETSGNDKTMEEIFVDELLGASDQSVVAQGMNELDHGSEPEETPEAAQSIWEQLQASLAAEVEETGNLMRVLQEQSAHAVVPPSVLAADEFSAAAEGIRIVNESTVPPSPVEYRIYPELQPLTAVGNRAASAALWPSSTPSKAASAVRNSRQTDENLTLSAIRNMLAAETAASAHLDAVLQADIYSEAMDFA